MFAPEVDCAEAKGENLRAKANPDTAAVVRRKSLRLIMAGNYALFGIRESTAPDFRLRFTASCEMESCCLWWRSLW